MKALLLDVDFSQIEDGQIKALAGNDGRIHGSIPVVKGHDGTNALYFSNQAGGTAAQYVDFGELSFGKDSFTVSLWIKTHRDGCNGWPHPSEIVSEKLFADGGKRNQWQKRYGGVLLANTGYRDSSDGQETTGFALANLQQMVYFNTCLKGDGGDAAVRLWGMKEPDDDRWHLLTIVFDREAWEKVYLDGSLIKEIDISSLADQGVDGGRLILGADGNGYNGLGEFTVSSLQITKGATTEAEIVCMFALEDVERIEEELKGRSLPSEIYSPESIKRIFSKAAESREKARELKRDWEKADENSIAGIEEWEGRRKRARKLRGELLTSYETFLMNTKPADVSFVLMTDAHVEGRGLPRMLAYGKTLAWAQELGLDAFADCGDYSNYGKEEELDGYWEAVKCNRGSMIPLISMGNHETLEKSCGELVQYHVGKLAENGAVPKEYEELYYEYTIGGCHFLVLSQYSDTYTVTGYNIRWAHAADIKEKQMKWLEERLREYSGQGHPIVLFIHNGIREVVVEETDGHYRERAVILSTWADAFYEMLERYPDVVICTGHVHHGLGDSCGAFKTRFGYHVIDVPSFCQNKTGYGMAEELGPVNAHTGYVIHIFGRKVLLRAVEFVSRTWLTSYDQLIETGE